MSSTDYETSSPEREPIATDDECGCPVYPAPEIRGDDADTIVEHGAGCPLIVVDPAARPDDDGPGRDQHGEHERGLTVDPTLMTGPSVEAVEHNPLRGRVSRILHNRHAGTILHEQAVQQVLDEVSAAVARARETDAGLDRAAIQVATRQIIAAVREASAPEYTAPLTLPAECVDVPTSGPLWQIQDARDERGWHDVTAVGECNNPQCTVLAGRGNPDEVCVVLVGDAWGDGFAHYPSLATVDVRIPAAQS